MTARSYIAEREGQFPLVPLYRRARELAEAFEVSPLDVEPRRVPYGVERLRSLIWADRDAVWWCPVLRAERARRRAEVLAEDLDVTLTWLGQGGAHA